MEFNTPHARYSWAVMSIAITGGVGEGKSTVLQYLEDLGYSVASSDVFAREVFSDSTVQQQVGHLLGVVPPVSSDAVRSALRDTSIRRALNRITHSRILAKLRESRAQFIEVPLLLEACLQGKFDRVWVVTCGHEEQLRRVSKRLGDVDAARELIGTQLASAVKIVFADCVIRTNCDETTVLRSVSHAAKRDLRG